MKPWISTIGSPAPAANAWIATPRGIEPDFLHGAPLAARALPSPLPTFGAVIERRPCSDLPPVVHAQHPAAAQ